MDQSKNKQAKKNDRKSEKQAQVKSSEKTAKKTNVSRQKVSEVKAKLRFLRISPKKVRLITDLIKGMPAVVAVDYLKLINKAATRPVIKLINSAIANAVNNFNLEKNNLNIKNIIVNQGPTLKRWQPRAHGRATPIRKRSSHVEVILVEKKVEPGFGKESKKNPKSQAPKVF